MQSHISWTVNGVPITQIFLMDRSHGADGLAVRDNIKSFADLKGKTIAVSAPGTTPHFFLSWMLSKNGIRLKDIRTVALEPQPAAQAFVSGRNDAAVSYEPYLSRQARSGPHPGHHRGLSGRDRHLRLHAAVAQGQPQGRPRHH